MKYAWMLLIAGISMIVISSAKMLDITFLLAGITAVAAAITTLFLNAKRLEALAERQDDSDGDSTAGRTAA